MVLHGAAAAWCCMALAASCLHRAPYVSRTANAPSLDGHGAVHSTSVGVGVQQPLLVAAAGRRPRDVLYCELARLSARAEFDWGRLHAIKLRLGGPPCVGIMHAV